MASVLDVAALIERELGPMSAYKLQKLVYYAQVWSLAWEGHPLFTNVIKAWTNGPVSPELWHHNKSGSKGNADALSPTDAETVRAVLSFYGPLDANTLIELTHREAPWRDARTGLGPHERGERPITHDVMRAYYGALASPGVKRIAPAVARGIELLLSVSEGEAADLFEEDDVSADAAVGWLQNDGDDPWLGSAS